MANPQPDIFTKISNELLEAFYHTNLSPHEHRVFWFIARKTWGFNKKMDWISESQFAKGIGLDRRIIHRNLKRLRDRNIITAIPMDGKKLLSYGIQKDYEKWKLPSTPMAKQKTAIHIDGTLSSTPRSAIHTDDKLPSTGMASLPSIRTYTKETITKETLQKKTPPLPPSRGVRDGGLQQAENGAKTDPGDGRLKRPKIATYPHVWINALGNGLKDWFANDFWPIQIRRVGNVGKRACAIEIYKLNPDADLRAKMVKALQSQIETDFKYRPIIKVPHPASWIKKKRWQDDKDTCGEEKSCGN